LVGILGEFDGELVKCRVPRSDGAHPRGKLDLIGHKLEQAPGQRIFNLYIDIDCGWDALAIHLRGR